MKVELSYAGDCVTAIGLPARPPADLTSDTTEFRHRIWEAIRQIPFGQTRTYQQLAEQIGHPCAARAVGGACAANRLLLAVPCHRVVASRGLGGFALGLAWKKKLLALEATAF